ncbi:YggS family pyridoxal phosphate-dependent enzyme [Oceanobacillus halotolerans]|uniref:YggS family pyridoxal phosphate-dependent enzyme n=1 Tax=Oceanobacillus halotolerans TaxID=2663380 RepID=UPI0013DC90B5|nr:YggS family pyridoxal phosphate-dependent enzyme [Oceanobacillus halotolerans]
MEVATNLATIKDKIKHACERSSRNPEDINIIGVTKYVTIERTKETIDAGITNLGENRLEGFLEKHNHFKQESVKWHFIGTLQSRKVKDVIDKVDAIHSLDRSSLAKEINKRASNPVACFVQVNVSGEKTKHGLEPEKVLPFIEELKKYENVYVVGLMTMAPHIDDKEKLRTFFRKLREIRDEIASKQYSHAPCNYLSMGMSNDYEIAIEEGATHIRIGSKLVGSN